MVDDFLECLSQSPNGKWAEMLKLVPYEGMHGRDSDPKILVCVGGTKSTLKCQLANKALIDWQATTVKKTGKKNRVTYGTSLLLRISG